MQTFLYQTAYYIYSNYFSEFEKIQLVFPNRRSSIFFLEYLKKINKKDTWLPQIFTISEFMQKQSSLTLADPIELLSELYKTFVEITKSKEDFDSFYFWGDMILRDFDDVDKFLVNAKSIFTNVSELKNIDSGFDFLSDEQKEVLKQFFQEFDSKKRTEIKKNFLEIWNYLYPIYKHYNKKLQTKNKAYEGMIYRNAVKHILENSPKETLYFFIGFNAITPCEEKIFEYLKNKKLALFFWDYDLYYIDNKILEAGRFIRKYLKKFPLPDDFNPSVNHFTSKKNIKMLSVSTDTAQVYHLGNSLNEMDKSDYSKTAIILSDEKILDTTLNHLPEKIEEINITMGYPIKNTMVGDFIDLIIYLQSPNSEEVFYYKHVLALLRHPYFTNIYPQESKEMIEKINSEFIFNLKKTDFLSDNELFEVVFRKVTTFVAFTSYLSEIFCFVQEKLVNFTEQGLFLMDFEQLYNVNLRINKLTHQLEEQSIQVSLPVFFRLLRKTLHSMSIPFEGEPIKGLQIMGLLESRNLDFKNVFVLSANDSFLPASSHFSSFIPHSLKQVFGMNTRKHHDAIYAYYFYRLIQKAENVTLLYNSSGKGINTGEKSRFLQQLLYDKNFKIEKEEQNQTIEIIIPESYKIQKKEKVKERLMEYLKEGTTKKLSPSAITNYMTCPIKFYHQNVLQIREEEELTEDVDARLFGNVFHNAAEIIYQPYVGEDKMITKQTIEHILQNKKKIEDAVNKSFTITFVGQNAKKEFTIQGKNLLIKEIVKKYLLHLLHIDKEIAPFRILGLEKNVSMSLKFRANETLNSIKIGGKIDRLDLVGDRLRIVDYKTGIMYDNKSVEFSKIFDKTKIDKNKAILQTMIYGLICSHLFPEKTKITPVIYEVKKFSSHNDNWNVCLKGEDFFVDSNILSIKEELTRALQELIGEIFDFGQVFAHYEGQKTCNYCNFNFM